MTEVKKVTEVTKDTEDNFLDIDIECLPGAIEINDDTVINFHGVKYTQREIGKGVDSVLNK